MTDRELRARLEVAQARRAVAQRRLDEQQHDESLDELRRRLTSLGEREDVLRREVVARRELLATHVANRAGLAQRVRAVKGGNALARLAQLVVAGTFLSVGLACSYMVGGLLKGLLVWPAMLVSVGVAGFCGWRLGRM